MRTSKACSSRDHFFFVFPSFLWSLYFHVLWHFVMSTCLINEVKQQWAMLEHGWVTASVHHSDGFAAGASRANPLLALLSLL